MYTHAIRIIKICFYRKTIIQSILVSGCSRQNTVPQRFYMLTLETYEYASLCSQRDFADVINVKIILDYLPMEGSHRVTRIPIRVRQECQSRGKILRCYFSPFEEGGRSLNTKNEGTSRSCGGREGEQGQRFSPRGTRKNTAPQIH